MRVSLSSETGSDFCLCLWLLLGLTAAGSPSPFSDVRRERLDLRGESFAGDGDFSRSGDTLSLLVSGSSSSANVHHFNISQNQPVEADRVPSVEVRLQCVVEAHLKGTLVAKQR